jgi:hypothetical protein
MEKWGGKVGYGGYGNVDKIGGGKVGYGGYWNVDEIGET